MASELAPEENSADSGISMIDVLEEEKQLEDDANAVLGDSDDKNCTYPLGYLQRQAVYSCETCIPHCDEPAGICLACSYECHEGHDLHELYTKRNFRCDCGNSKFSNLKCKLSPVKDSTNSDNEYNQNFRGLYCTCSRPYPDPEDDTEDEMIQCVVCEDWFHGRHLGSAVPENTDYQEMICPLCMEKHGFLWAYHVSCHETRIFCGDQNMTVDVESSDSQREHKVGESSASHEMGESSDSQREHKVEESRDSREMGESSDSQTLAKQRESVQQDTKSELSRTDSSDDSQISEMLSQTCKLKELSKSEIKPEKIGIFWPGCWRQKLCRCGDCMKMYAEKGVTFLLEEGDTVSAYEERGKAKHSTGSQYDQGMKALSDMDRIQQVEVLHGFFDLKSELSNYLQKFAENKKIVREEDIKEFFTQMEARKRMRSDGGIQYNCK